MEYEPFVLARDNSIIPGRKLSFAEYEQLNSVVPPIAFRQIFLVTILLPIVVLWAVRTLPVQLRAFWGWTRKTSELERCSPHPSPSESSATGPAAHNPGSNTAASTELPPLDVFFRNIWRDAAVPRTLTYIGLTSVVQLAVILAYLYATDVYHVFAIGKRTYSRTIFLGLHAALFVGSFFTICKSSGKPTLWNRDQTEEWKGWMQVTFVWYHYFAAAESYNLIRVLIAIYVWMTGFGNFSYFWYRGDYSFVRIWKKLWRLDFGVIVFCMALNKPYMLYYICPLHTLWFLVSWFVMWVGKRFNYEPFFAPYLKITIAAAISWTLLLSPWGRPLFDAVFYPLYPLLSFQHKGLYEWYFRCRLDAFVPLFGMACACLMPTFTLGLNLLNPEAAVTPPKPTPDALKSAGLPVPPPAQLTEVVATQPSPASGDSKEREWSWSTRTLVRLCIVLVGVALLWWWVQAYFWEHLLNKKAYNAVHPFVSWIPLIGYSLLRNCHSTLRSYHLGALSFIGKITLETYLCQHHIYLANDAKTLLVYPGLASYPAVNFVLATVIYVAISYKLMHVTEVRQ